MLTDYSCRSKMACIKLNTKTGAELAEAFAAIPVSVKTIKVPAAILFQKAIQLLHDEINQCPESVVSDAAAGAGSAPATQSLSSSFENRKCAVNLLLQIPEEAAIHSDACKLLWPELYGMYLEQQVDKRTSTTPIADMACSIESGEEDLTLKDIMSYAMGADELTKLFVNRHPDVSIEPGYKVNTIKQFQFAESYLKEIKNPGDRLIVGSKKYTELQYGTVKCGAGYGF